MMDPGLQSLWNAAKANSGKPGPIDPIDADNMQRSARVRDHLSAQGYQLSAANDRSKYPRGVSVNLESGHRVSLTPEGDGWNARVSHPDAPSAGYHDSRLSVDDSHVGAALRVHLTRPDVQDAMRGQARSR